MKKFIVALLIIALLAGSAAVEAGPIPRGQYVKFNYDLMVYSWPDDSNDSYETGTVVAWGSIGYVVFLETDNSGHEWAHVRLSEYGEEGNQSSKRGRYWGGWVRSGGLSTTGAEGVDVRYAQGGFGNGAYSHRPGDVYRDPSCKNHVKATASVWLHRTYGLGQNYGKALKKGQKVKYRHLIGIDERGVKFYAVRYEGKCLWVSSKYTKLVK
jgi:hypothetical protein